MLFKPTLYNYEVEAVLNILRSSAVLWNTFLLYLEYDVFPFLVYPAYGLSGFMPNTSNMINTFHTEDSQHIILLVHKLIFKSFVRTRSFWWGLALLPYKNCHSGANIERKYVRFLSLPNTPTETESFQRLIIVHPYRSRGRSWKVIFLVFVSLRIT